MKNLLLLLACSWLVVSCSVRKKIVMGTKPTSVAAPYIKTETATIPAKTVKMKNSKIVADGHKYAKKSVVSFSDGKNEFARAGKKTFARKKLEGDITIYSSTVTSTSTSYVGVSPGNASGWHTSSSTHTVYYLQSSTSPALMLLNYANTKSLIKQSEPAYKYILAYDKGKKNAKMVKYIGLGVMVAGCAMAFTSNNDAVIGAGAIGFFGGAITGIVGYIKQLKNGINLQKAIGRHNGTYSGKDD